MQMQITVIGMVQDITAIVGRVVTRHSLHGGNNPIVGQRKPVFKGLKQERKVAQQITLVQSHIQETLCVLTRTKKLLMIGM
jgi:anthranilate/para-aminobenzoate synthase component II